MKRNETYKRPQIDTRDSKEILRSIGPAEGGAISHCIGIDDNLGCDDR
jgi:hypothetical protein